MRVEEVKGRRRRLRNGMVLAMIKAKSESTTRFLGESFTLKWPAIFVYVGQLVEVEREQVVS